MKDLSVDQRRNDLILRTHPGKEEMRVYDYVDANVPKLLRMYKKRLKAFLDIGYTVE